MPNTPVPASAISLPFSSRPPRRFRTDLVADVSHWQPPAPATPRAALEGAIEAAIALLDASEPDPDLESYLAGHNGPGYAPDAEGPEEDHEPSLGAPNDYHGSGSQEHWGAGAPLSLWDADREGPEEDLEPSLGALEKHPSVYGSQGDQTSWGFSGNDRDLEEEHDGKEPDADREPSHGSTSAINQEHAWAPTETFWGSGEGEPSLAFTNIPAMLPRGYDADREYDVADAPHDAEDDCDDTERSGDRPDAFTPCLDQRVEENTFKGVAGHPRALHAIAREQRAMQRTAKRLRKIVKRLRESA
jgi:hypothetical protein